MHWLKQLFPRRRRYHELSASIQEHLDEKIEDLMDRGLTREQAERSARCTFGNPTVIEERSREVWQWSTLESILADLRYTFRQLRRYPGFAVTAILVLALGIGASVAIFAFVDAALLEPLPYADPNRLMAANESSAESPGLWPLAYPDFVDWQGMNKSLSSLDVFAGTGFLVHTREGAEPVRAGRVSGGFFRTLGVRPILGRDFAGGEDRLGGPNVTLISYSAWLRRFGRRKDVVGQAVSLDNTSYTILGVLPRSFSFALAGNAEFWVPINTLSRHEQTRNFFNFFGVGRLRDGVSRQTAEAELTAIEKQLQNQYPNQGRNLTAQVVPLAEVFVGNVRPILLTLLGGAGLLLLIACVNVASLVLVRSESRRREVAVRGALGATRGRLVRQFTVEGLLLAAAGELSGVVVAAALMRLLGELVPKDMAANMPFLDGVNLNAHTAVFACLLALGAALLLAGTATVRLPFEKVRDGLVAGDRGAASRLWQRLGANLAVMELAIAVVLLAGAGLLGKSFYRLLHVPLGFDANQVATLRVTAPDSIYKGETRMAELSRQIVERVKSLPGMDSAGMTSQIPAECDCATDRIHFPPRPYHGEHNEVDERHVNPGYLPALKAALVRGRFFTEDDDSAKPGVAVINEALAREFFPGEDPLGQKIADDEGGRDTEWEIVGVVSDLHESPLDAPDAPTEYFPLSQTGDDSFTLVARTRQDAASLLPELVRVLHQIDPNLGVYDEGTMRAKIEGTQAALLHRFAAWLIGGFAGVALVLSVVGLYGVIAYSVSQRTREIGVRMALGAQRSAVYGLVMGQAVWLIGTGLLLGLASAVGVASLIRKMLFGVAAWDTATLLAVASVLGAAALAASFIPAQRAASVNPVEALRSE
ncbi:MAG TPA: ABC transporter permease [Terracidiphilus sp.]|jgi:predicted permease